MHRALVLGVALALAAAFALPVSAHINDVAADPQHSADGVVVAETAYMANDGWLAVYPTEALDEPVGHVDYPGEGGFRTDLAVRIDPVFWSGFEEGTVHLVLHRDDGDDEFEPGGDDGVLSTFGRTASAAVPLKRTAEPAFVTIAAFAPPETDGGTLTVRNATLPERGHLVVTNASTGETIGSAALDAGNHREVTVPLAAGALGGGSEYRLSVTLYTDDGGSPGAPLVADNALLRTTVRVSHTGNGTAATPTATPAESSFINTPTATPDPTPTAEPTAPSETTGSEGPGFGVAVALLSLLVVGALLRRVGR